MSTMESASNVIQNLCQEILWQTGKLGTVHFLARTAAAEGQVVPPLLQGLEEEEG